MSDNSSSQASWFGWALFTALCFGCITIIFRFLTDMGTANDIIVGSMFGVAALLAAPFHLRDSRKASRAGYAMTALIGLIASVQNVFQTESIRLTPNPGYTVAIVGGQVFVVSLLAVPLFGASLGTRQLCGVLMVVGGVLAMALG